MTDPPVKLRLIDFVQCVLERPYLYTAHSSYDEIIAFIEGYHVGHCQRQTQWFAFGSWLKGLLGDGEGRLMVRFRQAYEDDALALQQLHELYNAFLWQPDSGALLVEE
ncbi:hypothetical protein [Deinococcus sp. QL22]|uniref:hypothetical protein n=1 Tax=Deinococcus sp. QL22 TaxID=2939437 RepID=UPI002017F57A|nr:hypothetical protein [Deinococcus sp. QL22]UQN10713.1 hypothetical protein M1R55_30545 [Deinococcus sp. QL22]